MSPLRSSFAAASRPNEGEHPIDAGQVSAHGSELTHTVFDKALVFQLGATIRRLGQPHVSVAGVATVTLSSVWRADALLLTFRLKLTVTIGHRYPSGHGAVLNVVKTSHDGLQRSHLGTHTATGASAPNTAAACPLTLSPTAGIVPEPLSRRTLDGAKSVMADAPTGSP